MEKHGALRQLLALSKIHHQLAIEEKWSEWESVADRKEGLYLCLESFQDTDLAEEEKKIVMDIERLEEQTTNELKKKKRETKQDIIRVNRVKGALRGYGKVANKGSRRGFGIKC